jgi:ribosomal protein S18 acetylase RimI-like enzyme
VADFLSGGAVELTKQIVTGLVGGAIATALTFLISYGKQIYLRFKYPVAGKYISYNEDVQNGEKVTQTAFTKLGQRGRHVRGWTKQKDGRAWFLDGTIKGNSHISGSYSAQATYDEGVGVFYLKMLGSHLDGVWSGYDYMNKTVSVGRYIFKRLLPIKIKQAYHGPYTGLLTIAARRFGPGYLSENDMKSNNWVVHVAVYRRRIVGFVLGGFTDFIAETKDRLSPIPFDIPAAATKKTLGIIKTIAVDSEFEGMGVGDRLFTCMAASLKKRGGELIVVPSWKSNKGVHLQGILKTNGYEPFLTEARFWKSGCDAKDFCCGSRTDECVCDLVWYRKAI